MNRLRLRRCAWLRFLLFPLIALTTAAALSTVVLARLSTREFWVSSLSDDAYVTTMQNSLAERLETECLFLGLDYDSIKDSLDTETVRSLCQTYAGTLYDALREGDSPTALSVSPDLFRQGIDTFFTSLGKTNMAVESATRQEISEALARETENTLQVFPAPSLLVTAHRYTFGHPLFSVLLQIPVWLCLALVVLLFLLLCFGAADFLSAAGSAFGALWCGSAVCFIPFTVFWQSRLPEKLALDGNLKHFASTAISGILNLGERWFSVAFGFSLVGLITTAVFLLIRQHRRSKEQPSETA